LTQLKKRSLIESQTRGLLVYCDDYLARLFSQKQNKSSGIWTQSLLMYALNNKIINNNDYYEAVIELVLRRFNYTSINAIILFYLFEKEGFVHSPKVLFLISVLGRSDDVESNVKVACEFIFFVWNSPCPLLIKRNILGTVFEVLKYNDNKNQKVANASMRLRSNNSKYHKQLAQAIQDWRDGLLIVPDIQEIMSI